MTALFESLIFCMLNIVFSRFSSIHIIHFLVLRMLRSTLLTFINLGLITSCPRWVLEVHEKSGNITIDRAVTLTVCVRLFTWQIGAVMELSKLSKNTLNKTNNISFLSTNKQVSVTRLHLILERREQVNHVARPSSIHVLHEERHIRPRWASAPPRAGPPTQQCS